MKKSILSGIAVLVLLASSVYFFRAPLSVAVAKRVALSHLAADVLSELPDGLHVGLCGAGSFRTTDLQLAVSVFDSRPLDRVGCRDPDDTSPGRRNVGTCGA